MCAQTPEIAEVISEEIDHTFDYQLLHRQQGDSWLYTQPLHVINFTLGNKACCVWWCLTNWITEQGAQ